MPVVNILKTRIKSVFPNKQIEEILGKLPFVGLDIEGLDKSKIRVEYNPNRPDFSSDTGIFRTLKGLLNETVGLPSFKYSSDKSYQITIDPKVKEIRPILLFFVAKNTNINNFILNQLISMQEDLHNGIARARKKAAIGIHDLNTIEFPLNYSTKSQQESFIPLDQTQPFRLKEILSDLEVGKRYSSLIKNINLYPTISDTKNQIISFPPIINSSETKINDNTNNLLIEITGTNLETCKNILAIIAYYLYDEGYEIFSGIVHDDKSSFSSLKLLKDNTISVDPNIINSYLGLDLSIKKIIQILNRCRIDASIINNKKIKCLVPSYRNDIINFIDIVEEVAIGYGIDNIQSTIPSLLITSGRKNDYFRKMDEIKEILTGLGFLEMVNFTMLDRTISSIFNFEDNELLEKMKVKESKSKEHEFLRTNILSSLVNNLSYNVHEDYPQKVFEIGKIFSFKNKIVEEWNLGVLIASNNSNYTEAKSIAESIFKINFDKNLITRRNDNNNLFLKGRCADIIYENKTIGFIGEVTPDLITKFNLHVPLSAFELNLSPFLKVEC
ncbi:MAG TPA: phenylalanine--tRNA ligase subunit beta [Nitrososphaeraceae archaeon]|nr:phenylalanine--tRNA ligase subunit beta [Nitrososphaeraceae archaeon]